MSNQKPNFPLYETGKRTNQAQIKQVEGNFTKLKNVIFCLNNLFLLYQDTVGKYKL